MLVYADLEIEEMGFSVRSYNVLKRSGVNTLEQLRKLTLDQIIHMHNCGKRTAEEIIHKTLLFTEIVSNKVGIVHIFMEGCPMMEMRSQETFRSAADAIMYMQLEMEKLKMDEATYEFNVEFELNVKNMPIYCKTEIIKVF